MSSACGGTRLTRVLAPPYCLGPWPSHDCSYDKAGISAFYSRTLNSIHLPTLPCAKHTCKKMHPPFHPPSSMHSGLVAMEDPAATAYLCRSLPGATNYAYCIGSSGCPSSTIWPPCGGMGFVCGAEVIAYGYQVWKGEERGREGGEGQDAHLCTFGGSCLLQGYVRPPISCLMQLLCHSAVRPC